MWSIIINININLQSKTPSNSPSKITQSCLAAAESAVADQAAHAAAAATDAECTLMSRNRPHRLWSLTVFPRNKCMVREVRAALLQKEDMHVNVVITANATLVTVEEEDEIWCLNEHWCLNYVLCVVFVCEIRMESHAIASLLEMKLIVRWFHGCLMCCIWNING